MKELPKRLLVTLIVFLMLVSLFSLTLSSSQKPGTIDILSLVDKIDRAEVTSITIIDNRLVVELKDGSTLEATKETNESLGTLLKNYNVDPEKLKALKVTVEQDTSLRFWVLTLLPFLIPFLIVAVFIYFMMRQVQGANSRALMFGQSKARIFNKDLPKVTFADVAGVDDAKKELEEVVDFLKNPSKYKALGARTPKGVILVGPSGTGKTLLAKAMAGEARTVFYSIAGSEFMEMLVGVGAARVRDLFSQAKKNAPAIIFIDEIDAIGRMRSVGIMGGHDEREQTLNQILVEMDGFEPNTAVLVVAATNRGDLLDPALTRPGRFDRRITLDLPDMEGRKAILAIHAKGKPFVKDLDWDKAAKRTVGFSGADLENMLNEAAILAARDNKKEIDFTDFEEAATKVKLGPEKKRLQSDADRKMTAYHEAGHAVVTYHMPGMDKVHRISIVSRGMALGYTLTPPEKDRLHETKSHLINQIASMMGGRAAEELIFKDITSGAANDIDQATRIARYMVMEFGMSDLGPINFGPEMDVTEWGKSLVEQQQISPDMLSAIDKEIKKFIDAGYKTAITQVKKHKKQMDRIVEVLLKKETIEGEEFDQLMST